MFKFISFVLALVFSVNVLASTPQPDVVSVPTQPTAEMAQKMIDKCVENVSQEVVAGNVKQEEAVYTALVCAYYVGAASQHELEKAARKSTSKTLKDKLVEF